MRPSIVLALALLCASAAHAAVYYCDPAQGNASNPGTAEAPWGKLEDCVGKLSSLHGGDFVLLKSGRHGNVSFGGSNDGVVTIAAAPGQRPELSRLEITQGKGWHVKGLAISPSFGEGYKGAIVTLGERGESSQIVLEDCYLFTAPDHSGWDAAKWMSANSGLTLGRHGDGLAAKNNYIYNTRFAMNLCGINQVAEANVISDFSADGMRMTRDGQQALYNVVKNVYVSDGDGDANHDDGIQCFLFNKGTGTVKNLTLRGNLIVNRERDDQPLKNTMQGIGFFDGPLIDFLVEKNVVLTEHWHGVSLYDAQNCTIQDNACFTRWESRLKPWVMLGSKQGQAKGNTVKNNMACSFNFKADAGVTAENNTPVTKEKFDARMQELLAEIEQQYGKYHPVAKFARLGTEQGENAPPQAVAAAERKAEAPAESAAAPRAAEPAPPPISPEQLASWQPRLTAYLAAATKDGKRPTVYVKLFGKQPEKLKLTACTEKDVTLLVQGNPMPWAWEKLDPEDRFNVIRAAADEADATSLALAAVWAGAVGRREDAEQYLAKARQVMKEPEKALVAEAQALFTAQ
ncbi:MAG: right-handed parallel beta-helix repeat-containing protein [Planctomycetota bacterium]|nr:right-handed parallel beta-helix repeat-containing protein [Planctomycetota bacterium]